MSNLSSPESARPSQALLGSQECPIFLEDDEHEERRSNNITSKKVVDFTPHYRTLTDGGKSHFSRAADALAEFIDNSMEACKRQRIKHSAWNVKVSFSLEPLSNKGYCIIADTGIGMNSEKLTQLPIYSLDQVTRKSITNADGSEANFISKYGVGAKEAGFYLGYRMQIVTKTKGTDHVLELTLDRHEFEDKFRRGDNPFTTDLITRAHGSAPNLTHAESKDRFLVDTVTKHERENESFTYIIITLDEPIVQSLISDNRHMHIPRELADIYHFHMNPQHRPNSLIEEKRFKGKSGSGPLPVEFDSLKGNIKLPHYDINQDADKSFLNLEYEIKTVKNGDAPFSLSLNKYEDHETFKFIKAARAAFRFNITVPNPALSVNNLTLGTQARTQQQDKTVINGILLYYPYDRGETRPDCCDEEESDAKPGIVSSTQGALISQASGRDRPSSAVEGGRKAAPTFNVYWLDRLVPETEVNFLGSHTASSAFFPHVDTLSKSHSEGIPLNWQMRVKGYLFCSKDFPITNNKLKFQLDPNFESWLNNKKFVCDVLYVPGKSILHSWMRTCHAKFDKEYLLEERCRDVEDRWGGRSCFSVLKVGERVLRAGEIIKVPNTDAKKEKGKRATVMMYVKIVVFIVNMSERLRDDDQTYCGLARFVYRREPEELYGSKEEELPMSLIDFNNDNYKTKKVDYAGYLDYVPHQINVFMFKQEQDCKEDRRDGFRMSESEKKPSEVTSGEKFYSIGVQIVGKHGHHLVKKPFLSSRFKVRFHIGESTGVSTHKVYEFKADRMEAIGPNNPFGARGDGLYSMEEFRNVFYCTDTIHFREVGLETVTVDVLDDDKRILLSNKYLVNVVMALHDFGLECANPTDAIRIGEFFPLMEFFMKNKSGEKIKDFLGTVKIEYYSPVLDFYSIMDESESSLSGWQDNKSVRFDINNPRLKRAANHVGFSFDESDKGTVYQARCLISEPKMQKNGKVKKLFTGEQYEEKMIDFEITCSYRPPQKTQFSRFGTPKKQILKFCPGLPDALYIPDAPDGLSLSAHDLIDSVTVGCIDRFGHVTAPRSGEVWEMFLTGEGEAPSVLEPQPDKKFEPAYVCSTRGTAVFRSLRVADTGGRLVSSRGLATAQKVLVQHTRCDGSSEPPAFAILEESFPVTLFPSSTPQSVCICMNGAPVAVSCTEDLGALLGDITFKVFDSNNDPMEYDPTWFDGLACGVELSWHTVPGKSVSRKPGFKKARSAGAGSRLMDPQGFALPSLQLPPDVASFPVECTATFHFFKAKAPLLVIFEVFNNPPVASRWRLLVSPSIAEGLLAGESGDLLSKIIGVSLQDEHGNDVEYDEAVHPQPQLSLRRADDDTQLCAFSMERPSSAEQAEQHFVLPAGSVVALTGGTVTHLVLTASDESGRFSEDAMGNLIVCPGLPREVRISFLGDEDRPSAYASLKRRLVTPYTEISDLAIQICDGCGNTINGRALRDVRYSLVMENGAIVREAAALSGQEGSAAAVAPLSVHRLLELLRGNRGVSEISLAVEAVCLAGGAQLQSAYLTCEVVQVNGVRELATYTLSPGTIDSAASSGGLKEVSRLSVHCDQKSLPRIAVVALTFDGNPFLPSELHVSAVSAGGAGATAPLSVSQERDERGGFTLLHVAGADHEDCLPAGLHRITVGYTEHRAAILDAMPAGSAAPVVVKEIEVEVLPGALSALTLSASCRQSLSDVVVSNSITSAASREIGKITVVGVDKYGNACAFPESITIFCAISRLDDMGAVESLPLLVGCDSRSRELSGFMALDRLSCDFSSMHIQSGSGTAMEEERLTLRFTARESGDRMDTGDPAAVHCSSLRQLKVPFTFCTDEATRERALAVAQKKKQVEEQLQLFETMEAEVRHFSQKFAQRIKEARKATRNVLILDLLSSGDVGLAQLSDAANNLSRQVADMTSSVGARKAKVDKRYNEKLAIAARYISSGEYVGQIAQIAYVDDEVEAQLLSSVAKGYMQLVVCKSAETMEDLCKHGLEAWAEDMMPTVAQIMVKARENKPQGILQLPLSGPGYPPIEGNPEFALNKLVFESEKLEYLRETAFFNIFKTMIIIDDINCAIKYKRRLKEKGFTHAYSFVGRNGNFQLSSEGIMRSWKISDPRELRYIFGQPSPTSSADFTDLTRDVELLGGLKALFEEKLEVDKKQKQLQSSEPELREMRERVRVMDLQLQKLGSLAQEPRPSSPPPEPQKRQAPAVTESLLGSKRIRR